MKIISHVLEDGKPPILLDDYLIANSKRKLDKEKIKGVISIINKLMVFFGVRLKLSKTNINNRTALQNNSLHLLYKQTADKLNNAGYDVKTSIPDGVDWNMLSVKEQIWKELQRAVLRTDSTAQLTTTEVGEVFEEFNRFLATKKIHVPFPSVDGMLFDRNYGDQ